MTTRTDPGTGPSAGRGPAPWRPRSEAELLQGQVLAIEAWNAARRAARDAAPGDGAERSREARLDLARRQDVVRRQHAALVAHTERQLRSSAHVLASRPPVRALVVHRDTWFVDRVARDLGARGVQVVAQLDNGADAVGVVVAEQPDLLLVQDRLPMLGGAQVLQEALPFAPGTLAVGHVESDAAVLELLAAGACAVHARRVPPAEVAQALCELVRQ